MRLIYTTFSLLFSLGILVSLVEAEPRVISLSHLDQVSLKTYQNVPIKLVNTFETGLYDLTVTRSSLSKKIVSVSELGSEQSFNLSFSKIGTYEICFARQINEARTCLNLKVLKRIII
jgi:hypothetical protein